MSLHLFESRSWEAADSHWTKFGQSGVLMAQPGIIAYCFVLILQAILAADSSLRSLPRLLPGVK